MKSLTIHIPDQVHLNKDELQRLVAARLYEKAELSLGQAAALAGLSKWEFADILSEYGVSLINYPASEIARDVKNA